jgi:hypothetical protein
MRITLPCLAACALLLPAYGQAQDAALDDKLRDLLRQTTVQLRAAEDNTATLQASLDSMTKQRDALAQQLQAAQAKPAAPAISPQQVAAAQQAEAALAQARAQAAQSSASLQHWQAAYQQAAAIARDKDASDRQNAAGLAKAGAALAVCKAENAKLIDTAEDILHLYETPKFKELLIANHERLLGFKRVALENLVQDYDDRIAAQSYVEPAASPGKP